MLDHRSNRCRANAAKALSKFDPEKTNEILSRMLAMEDKPHFRISGCHAIGALKAKNFLPTLRKLLREDLIFCDALKAIESIGGNSASEALRVALGEASDEEIKSEIQSALLRLSSPKPSLSALPKQTMPISPPPPDANNFEQSQDSGPTLPLSIHSIQDKLKGIAEIEGIGPIDILMAVGLGGFCVFLGWSQFQFDGNWHVGSWIFIHFWMIMVYWDATRNHIGRISADEGSALLSIPPIAWTIATGGLLIVCLPAYLISRSFLINIAKKIPQVVPTGRRFLCFIVLALSLVLGCFVDWSLNRAIQISAVPLVNRILHEQFKVSDLVECLEIEMGEEYVPNNFRAKAILNNGNKMKITIQRMGKQIKVIVPPQNAPQD